MDKINYISGIRLTPLKKIENPLGDVYHGIKISDIGYVGFQEAYFSTILCGTIKPWKKHTKMTLNLIVPVGEVRFILFDGRVTSTSYNQFMDITLSLENYYRLTVPPNIWMAFEGKGPSINLLLNIANLEHDPEEIERLTLDQIPYHW